MAETRKFWGQKTMCLVTGASQGIGKHIAVEFAKKLGDGSLMALVARSEQKLEQTKQELLSVSPNLDVVTEVYDLSKPDIGFMEGLMKKCTKDKFDLYIVVHNAGTEGSGKPTSDMSDLGEWQEYMSLNLFSMTMLTSAFLKSVGDTSQRCLINITSLAAIQPIKGLGYYCIGKSSREMYLKVLALENPSLDILNYSPGPVKTEMVDRVIDKCKFSDTKDMFHNLRENDTLVKLEQTVPKLVKILDEGSYKSGGRIDYYD